LPEQTDDKRIAVLDIFRNIALDRHCSHYCLDPKNIGFTSTHCALYPCLILERATVHRLELPPDIITSA
jgi:hypothetical protein